MDKCQIKQQTSRLSYLQYYLLKIFREIEGDPESQKTEKNFFHWLHQRGSSFLVQKEKS